MKYLLGTSKIILKDMRLNMLIFWTILISTSLASLIITASFKIPQMYMFTNLPTCIYLSIIGAILFRSSFPYTLSFGSTRKQFIVSLGLIGLFLVFLNASINFGVFYSLEAIANYFELPIHYFSLANTLTNPSLLSLWLVDFIVTLFLFCGSLVISLIHYRYGGHSLLLMAGAAFIVMLLPPVQDWFVGTLLPSFSGSSGLLSYSGLALAAVLLFGVAALLMRNIPVLPRSNKNAYPIA